MDDLISRQAVIDALGGEPLPYTEYEQGLHDKWIDAKENIETLPSAQPEIIQCKECKYADDMPIADGKYWCNYHNGYFSFCSEAKRKEE